MSESVGMYDHLLAADGPAAIILEQWLKPVGDPVIFPPTYANPSGRKGDPPVYNIDRFGETASLGKRFEKFEKTHTFVDIDRVEHGRINAVCVIDSIPSQANRIEPAFDRVTAEDGTPIRLVPKVRVRAIVGGENRELNLLVDAGHRIADAMIRYTSIGAEVTDVILARKNGNSFPLAKLAPTSLVFGMWDSQKTGVKVPRLVNSIIRAYDVREYRRSSQFNPAMDFEAADVATDPGDKKLSELGMDGAPSTFQHGGIEALGGIRRHASLNLCTLRDLAAVPSSETRSLQRYILGLSLIAITYFDGATLNLRQGCQLVGDRQRPLERKCVNADGSETEFSIDKRTAISYALLVANDFGVGQDHVDATFNSNAAKAARKRGKKDRKEDEGE